MNKDNAPVSAVGRPACGYLTPELFQRLANHLRDIGMVRNQFVVKAIIEKLDRDAVSDKLDKEESK